MKDPIAVSYDPNSPNGRAHARTFAREQHYREPDGCRCGWRELADLYLSIVIGDRETLDQRSWWTLDMISGDRQRALLWLVRHGDERGWDAVREFPQDEYDAFVEAMMFNLRLAPRMLGVR